ncbi:methylated-DNA--[protein]-cysteine S-methyltransferase [Carnobacterium gallinarum]|uniref:methylated-DNA--[protein]-cysteine S-methyltransferase n=1 Tax=Carnobacterium gallinarum TaxID=2749 RepID=UPI00054E211E|nr:methylated-DNA--[protein]-cysteine S-methyltransferase [Carnobacterium gallinarum]
MKQENQIYWEQLTLPKWQLIVAATDTGICFIGSNYGEITELENWIARKRPASDLIREASKLTLYFEMLANYLQGEQQSVDLPLDVQGTVFQEEVWRALTEIPYGQTVTYSEIAIKIERPDAVRAVGTAIGANPVLILIPCHRVLGKNRKLTGYRGGLAMKKDLLGLEKGS